MSDALLWISRFKIMLSIQFCKVKNPLFKNKSESEKSSLKFKITSKPQQNLLHEWLGDGRLSDRIVDFIIAIT
jgi:hypothetical protein